MRCITLGNKKTEARLCNSIYCACYSYLVSLLFKKFLPKYLSLQIITNFSPHHKSLFISCINVFLTQIKMITHLVKCITIVTMIATGVSYISRRLLYYLCFSFDHSYTLLSKESLIYIIFLIVYCVSS